MRLRLVAQTDTGDPEKKGWRLLERGELTLGRDPKCHWPVEDPQRRISKVHCRIRRDATGFTLTDESTNGLSVDRKELAQGQTVRLEKGSVIAFCAQRFVVEITGEVDPDWRDPDERYSLGEEVPSITAILSDVSPGGSTATGVLPGSGKGDNWINALDDGERSAGGDRPASRPEIGWASAPDEAITGSGFGGIPDDWDTDLGTASRAEHRVATTTRMRVPRPGGEAGEAVPFEPPAARTGADEGEASGAFFEEAGLRPVFDDPIAALSEAGREHRAMRDALEAIARDLADFFEDAGMERPGRLSAADAPLVLVQQRSLLAALRALLQETDRLAPGEIELQARLAEDGAKGLAAKLPVPGRAERAVLDHYRRAYAGAVGGSPRMRFADALGRASPDAGADDFEELSAERPRHGDRV
jgi:predicted component of type VI protein secretion system